MDFIFYFITHFSFVGYISLLGLIGGLYVGFIGPLLFTFWIIPKIENRYRTTLVFDNPAYQWALGAKWFIPILELSFSIFCLRLNYSNRYFNNKYAALKKINYNIKSSSKAEIILSFLTIFFITYFIFTGVGFWIMDKYS